jgi:hypothetical protein
VLVGESGQRKTRTIPNEDTQNLDLTGRALGLDREGKKSFSVSMNAVVLD